MVIDRNILKITITELRHSCDVVERCVRDYGIMKPVSWRWEADDVSRYMWNDACMRVKNPKGLRPCDAAAEIAALALEQGVIIEAQSNGSLVLRPTRMQFATEEFVRKKIIESFQAELAGDVMGRDAGGAETIGENPPTNAESGLFRRFYGIGAAYDPERPLSSLRPFAQMIVHSQVLDRCASAESGSLKRAQSSFADELVGKQLESFIDGSCSIIDLSNSPEEDLSRELFCWLWSGTYPRKLFIELVNQRPKWRWCSVGRDFMLPSEAEVPLKVFQDKAAVWALLLLLSSSIPGADLAPLCALFDEEANIPWHLKITTERLARIREELMQRGDYEFDQSLNLMIDDDFSEAIFQLASLDYEAIRHTSSLYVSYYVERVWNATRAVSSVLARRVCSGRLKTFDPRYVQFLELAFSTLRRHGDLLGVDIPCGDSG